MEIYIRDRNYPSVEDNIGKLGKNLLGLINKEKNGSCDLFIYY